VRAATELKEAVNLIEEQRKEHYSAKRIWGPGGNNVLGGVVPFQKQRDWFAVLRKRDACWGQTGEMFRPKESLVNRGTVPEFRQGTGV